MKKKILFVIDSLGCGGAEKSLVSLLPLLDRNKYEIHLWMLHRGGTFETLLPQNIIIEDVPNYSHIESILYRIGQIHYSITYRIMHLIGIKQHGAELLWKCVSKTHKVPKVSFDVAIAYQQGMPTYLVATKINAKKKMAWINANIFNAGYDPHFNEYFYNMYDALVPVSTELEDILRKQWPKFSPKFHCIYDILNPQIIKQQAKESVSNEFLLNHKCLLVTTGRLAPQKNHILAVEAANILKQKRLKFRWLFIGEGKERQKIETLLTKYGLQSEVKLLGMQTNPYPYMAKCDVYVQTSSFEGFGLTIAEAKILNRPVVSTNFDVVHDQLIHEKNGLIADMTAESVADNILRMLSDKKTREHILQNIAKENNTTYLTEATKVEKLLDED